MKNSMLNHNKAVNSRADIEVTRIAGHTATTKQINKCADSKTLNKCNNYTHFDEPDLLIEYAIEADLFNAN